MKEKSSDERYERQVILKGFGDTAQKAMLQARVLVIGAGGLGCPVLQYLSAAGTGTIGIVDDDVVSLSNLHRQVLYDTYDIGKPKVRVAVAKLRLFNPDVELVENQLHLDKNNCLSLISEYDIVVDCTDNFASRYMINDACVLKEKPLVFAAVNRFEGQVAVFNWRSEGKKRSGNYRDLFPVQPLQQEVMNCAEAGVLGVLPGIIGSMQANETIKLITGIGKPLIDQLLTYNTLDNNSILFNYSSNSSAYKMPVNEKEFLEMDYEEECLRDSIFVLDAKKFDGMRVQNNLQVIDVREQDEFPLATEFENVKIPLGELKSRLKELSKGNIIFFCQSGSRSLKAATIAAEHFGNTNRFFSLKGGIVGWKKIQQNN